MTVEELQKQLNKWAVAGYHDYRVEVQTVSGAVEPLIYGIRHCYFVNRENKYVVIG